VGTPAARNHGLSLLITVHIGGGKRTLLFDAGPEGATVRSADRWPSTLTWRTFLRNANILGIDFAEVQVVVLSHGHWDHAGGLAAALQAIAAARPSVNVECFVHPGMFRQRGMKRPNGDFLVYEPIPDVQTLEGAGARVINTREPRVTDDGAFYVSGEIPRLTKYEVGLPGHMRRSEDGESWEPDPLIMDERFISVHVKDKGQFVFSACSHAGLINVLNHARSMFPAVPLYGVMGGLHLAGNTEKIIPDTIADLRQFGLKLLAPGHCTGRRALSLMAKEFGEELIPTAVGKKYVI
jgi:7,8-dihydropterin-6-yl-methyl-4-(beta-D-ribofuranosyl)aminobenzene 5'-phosphate synthase